MQSIRTTAKVLCLALSGAMTTQAGAAEFFGPVPYLSAGDTPAAFVVDHLVIEDFEDAAAGPGLTSASGSIVAPGGITDSVDADDGAIDGSGNGGHTLFGSSIRIDFPPPYPRAAGMVWTDGAAAQVTFHAFGPDGGSLGSVGPEMLGDGSISGTTGEDRFFGAYDAGGISAIQFTSGSVMEVDHVQFEARHRVEPAIISTLGDGDVGILLRTLGPALPAPTQQALPLPPDALPHGLAFLGSDQMLFADFAQAQLYRVALADTSTSQTVPLPGRSNANGTLAAAPGGRFALSLGSSNAGAGEAVAIDFASDPPSVTPIVPALRVLSFVTDAVDFAPDGRAFVCHTTGISVLRPPYVSVDFTMPFPPTLQSPSMCQLTRDGRRLFVTRMLSEDAPSINAVRTTVAPFSAESVFVAMPAPADVQGLGPMAVSPDGQALLVGQQFLFPPAFEGTRARAFVLRAPFDDATTYTEIALPPALTGVLCEDGAEPDDCPGFEHIEVSEDGTLAILTGNSSVQLPDFSDSVPAVFVRMPFDDALRSAVAVPIGDGEVVPGRGTGGVRFQPAGIFRDGFEDAP